MIEFVGYLTWFVLSHDQVSSEVDSECYNAVIPGLLCVEEVLGF